MRVAVALGGNALGKTAEEQKEKVKKAAKSIIDIIMSGNKVLIGHGNGPQVGMIKNAFDLWAKQAADGHKMPFPECGAMSQGYIGFHLQNALHNELISRKRFTTPVVAIVTQCVVDENDPAFLNPTKPIGSFISREEADKLAAKGIAVKEDAGRGYRVVVASPEPIDIIEKESLKLMYEDRIVIIAGGGGGIPVINKNGAYVGVPAVIDKDFTLEKMAEIIETDVLLILTAVDKVSIKFGKPEQRDLDTVTVKEMEKYIADGEFAPGSMLPKVQACLKFLKARPDKKAIITSLEKADLALAGGSGTTITA